MSTASPRAPLAALLVVFGGAGCSTTSWHGESPPLVELEGLRSPELVAFTPDDDLTPSVTPGGRYVVFVSQQNGNLDVWARDYGTNSTYPITLNPTDDFDASVSPTGEQVVFVSRRSDAKGDLYLASSLGAGASVRRLTDAATQDRQPTFSPNGKHIYFTTAVGIGLEYISELELDSGRVRRVSPTPGFDPTVSPDGRYLIYTAPPGLAGRKHPHLVAMRLADTATRALTAADAPEGFARFIPPEPLGEREPSAIVYVRFPDDDSEDGELDANDQASIWRLPVDLDATFSGTSSTARPFPLTDGRDDELFPVVAGGFLYFTQGGKQQDILRLPAGGLFPAYSNPEQYFELARTIEDPRTRWFAYRAAAARAAPGSLLEAQANLRIGNLHQEGERPELARAAFETLVESARDPTPDSALGELVGLARVELVGLGRRARVAEATTARERDKSLSSVRVELERLSQWYAGSSRIRARVDLELAELILDRGDRVRAIEALEAVAETHAKETFSAARAMLRRIELLGVAHDPGAIAEAYARVLSRFPNEREIVREAARRIVRASLDDLRVGSDWRKRVDALRRVLPKYALPKTAEGEAPVSLVRTEARWRLARILEEKRALDDAALELEQLVEEVKGDRLGAARGLEALARVNEARGQLDAATENWRRLRSGYGDLPGVAATAREAITRVNLERASREEKKGDRVAARAAYHDVIENDVTQVNAHRRYLALSAETGALAAAVEEAKTRAESSPRTPIARYAHALALTWLDPPDFEGALEEIEEAIALNPQFTHAYITRGWIREMSDLETPGFFVRARDAVLDSVRLAIGGLLDVEIGSQGLLELAIEDYKTALRLNLESLYPETEAEILINLGNGHYRLSEGSKDLANMKAAFERYADALRLGHKFVDPSAELVFWERLGRSASWADEYAISAMASRRAIELAEALGTPERLAQLWGNLALAYDQAGEDAYARDALQHFESELAERKAKGKLVIALRDRARARLELLDSRSDEVLNAVLGELVAPPERLASVGELDRGELPTALISITDDGTRAQYGFAARGELDLNLALAETTHRALGDVTRAGAIRERRIELSRLQIDDPPKAFLIAQREPLTLGMVRELFGLSMAEVTERIEADDLPGARAELGRIGERLDERIDDERLARDQPALILDRARWLAARIELEAMATARGLPTSPEDPSAAVDDLMVRIAVAVAPPQTKSATAGLALMTTPELERLPLALTSTQSLIDTASVALARPRLPKIPREARAVRGRLLYAKALGHLARAHTSLRTSGDDPASLLGGVDTALGGVGQARDLFAASAREAAGGGLGLGARVVALSLAGLVQTERALRTKPEPMLRATAETAALIARSVGDEALATRIELAEALARPDAELVAYEERLRERLPVWFVGSESLVERLLVRTASAALGADKIPEAMTALDRLSLLRTAAARMVEISVAGSPSDREVSSQLRRRLSKLSLARGQLGRAGLETTFADYAGRFQRVKENLAALATEVEAARFELSERGAARLFGQAIPSDVLAYELAPTEALLFPVALGSKLSLFLLDGSEEADPKVLHRVATVPFESVQADLQLIHGALAAQSAPPPEVIARLRAVLFEPFAEPLKGKSTVVIAGTFLEGSIPIQVAPEGLALSHVSAPTWFALAKKALLVGVDTTVVVEAPGMVAPAGSERRIPPDEALELRTRKPPVELAPGDTRALDNRTAVEMLASRGHDQVIVAAELRLEPTSLGRSVFDLASAPRTPRVEEDEEARALRLKGESEAFVREVPLRDLDLPARSLVLSSVSSTPAGARRRPVGARDVARLDSALIPLGFATTVIVPSAVPAAVAERVVERYREGLADLSPAAALARAVREVAQTSPIAGQIALLGSPGHDPAGQKAFAAEQLNTARTIAVGAISKAKWSEAIPAVERWIRLQRESGDEKYVMSAYLALIGVLSDRVSPPDYARASDVQRELVEYQRAREQPAEKIADAVVDLAYLYSRAGDDTKAEATFQESIRELERLGAQESLARAWYKLASHEKDSGENERAASYMERAIAIYKGAGAYKSKKRPAEANLAVRNVAEIYLNRLSDPVRAKRAYERAMSIADSDDERIGAEMDLARVARRRGDFASAADHASRAQKEAAAKDLVELEISALVEAANVAWYQGDYRLGQVRCTRSIELSDELLKEANVPEGAKPAAARRKASNKRSIERLKIYALSVCGLVSMSQRDFEGATGHLMRALRIARRLGNEREVSAQYNNLGRVYLEFGQIEPAIDAFRRARAIDERLKDRYALAYDLRNLGRALAVRGETAEAKETLARALEYSVESKDANNELRARFALAEIHRELGELEEARKAFVEALPLAERLAVTEIDWQIHRALGLMARDAGRLDEAEAELRRAIAIVRSITGRAAPSDFGPHRYAAFDDLMILLLDRERPIEAFLVADLARSLEQVELLDDARIHFPSPEIPELLTRARQASTATAAEEARMRIIALAPRVGHMLSHPEVASAGAVPEDAAIVVYRVTDDEVVAFVLDAEGVHVRRSRSGERGLREQVAEYGRRLAARADLHEANARLGQILVEPIRGLIQKRKRLALVPHRSLRYVAFAALPYGDQDAELLVDRFELVQALHPAAARTALAASEVPVGTLPIVAMGVSTGGIGASDPPLPFAQRELMVIREEYPSAQLTTGDLVTKDAMLAAFVGSKGVFHFAGHGFLTGGPGRTRFTDPLGGQLRTRDGGLSMLEVLSAEGRPKLVVLSACSTLISPSGAGASQAVGDELLSLAQAFQLAGAESVLATTMQVSDLASSLVMKRFYRASRHVPPAAALREAQQAVRKTYPHPAWWATFALLSGG